MSGGTGSASAPGTASVSVPGSGPTGAWAGGPTAANASQAGGRSLGGDGAWDDSSGTGAAAAGSATPTRWTDVNADGGTDDASVPLPDTVYSAPVRRSGAETAAAEADAEAPTALIPGGSQLPPTVRESREKVLRAAGIGAPGRDGRPTGDGRQEKANGELRGKGSERESGERPEAPVGDAGSLSAPGSASGSVSASGATPPPPSARPAASAVPAGPGGPGAPASGYRPTQQNPQLPPEQGKTPPPGPPPAVGTPADGVHHAATVLSEPGRLGGTGAGGAGAGPLPPVSPPAPPGPPGSPPVVGTPPGGVHHAATVLSEPGRLGGTGAGGAGAGPLPPVSPPGPPGPAAYGYPLRPTGVPTVGPGYQAVLRYRAPDGSEARLIRRSAPGTPHPEWQLLYELRALGVPPHQVLELHTELESCRLPGGYCARMIAESWPQARITSIAPYGTDHAARQQGMSQLLTHQGELHQVADGPARPAPARAPLPQLPPAPPVPPQALAQELAAAFGPQGICRFDQRAVSRQGVPEAVSATLAWAGLPADFNPFFWAQPAHPVVLTLAELAAQRQVRSASDAASYLVVGNDFGRQICVQYGTAHIVAVPLEAGPDGAPAQPQFVNSGLPEFVRCMAMLGRMWRFRYGLTPEQAGRWTVDFQAHLTALDPAALSSPENWWSVLLEQMWDGLL